MKTPYPFQAEAIERGMQRNLLITDKCGLGKKLTALEIARRLSLSIRRPILVVTTKRDKYQWRREILEQDPDATVLIGGVSPIYLPGEDVEVFWLVLHYEALVRHKTGLRRLQWGTIIADEGHNIKNRQAQRSSAIKGIKAVRKLVLTGTPIENTPADLWNPLDFLYPRQFGDFYEFRDAWERAYEDERGYRVRLPGVTRPEALAELLAPFTFSRTKEEVAKDLPPNIIKRQIVKPTKAQAMTYNRIVRREDILVELPEMEDTMFIGSKLAELVRLQQVLTDPRLVGSVIPSAKLEWVRDWRADNPDEPVIIFTNFRDTALRLAKELDAHAIVGGVPIPEVFSKPTLVGTIAAASEALDLGWVRTSIFVDVNWRQILNQQAIDRIHRINITEPKQTIFLYTPGGIDELMLEAFEAKWSETEILNAWLRKASAELNSFEN